MKNLKWILTAVLVMGFAATSLAIPIVNTNGDGREDVAGVAYSYWQNSGTYLNTFQGNDNNISNVQALLNGISGYSGVTLTGTATITLTGAGTLSGTWAVDPSPSTIEFYSVKAGNYFALYAVNPADSTGSWSTFDIWKYLQDNNLPGYQSGGFEISHFTAFNPGSAPVPEPGTIVLLGVGLFGLGLFGRKRMKG
jgi:hypothetical protein